MSDVRSLLRCALVLLVVALEPGRVFGDQNPCKYGGLLAPAAIMEGIGGTGLRVDPDDESGLGGTGIARDPDRGGIGGTGIGGDDPDQGGIGGTGAQARGDVGIFGTVTGFGSICVGGTEIELDASTRIAFEGGEGSPSALAIGQVVAVLATGSGSRVRAREVEIRDVVRGRVSAVDAEQNRIEALGQTIQLGESTWTGDVSAPDRAHASDFAVGDFVRVSGLRRGDGSIAASLVARSTDSKVAWLTGVVTDSSPASFAVSGVRVEVGQRELPDLPAGDEVSVAGRWDGHALRATTVRPASPALLAARAERLQVEGFVLRPPSGGELSVGGTALRLDAATTDVTGLVVGERVRVEARNTAGASVVESIAPLARPRIAPEVHRPAPPRRDPGQRGMGRSVNGAQGAGGANPALRESVSPAGGERARIGARPPAGGRPQGAAGVVRPGPAERPVRPERPQRPQAPERPQRPERPERPVRPERPERPERPDRPERPERPERPQRPDLPDRLR